MPYIKQVRIQGFQSHIDSTFTLSPGLSIITGPSDAGKTAIIRALRWLAFNEPQGEAFIHAVRDGDGNLVSQAEQATVTVELDDGTVISKTRRKGKTIYTHSAYADPWEKAELPLEIKETLGLHKQQYGDNFETCLNFAYQLDPPFMLSETGSTGAKILGKLAGTEVVDKAIGAVVKQTHQTREIIRQSEKAIGQYDVELLEFLHTEEHLERVEDLTKQYSAVEAKIKSIGQLAELGKRYSTYRVRRDEAYATLIQLESVPTLVASLEKVDSIYDKLQQVKGLAKAFWDSVHKRTDLRTKLKRLSEVPELAVDLQQIQKDNDRLYKLQTVTGRHTTAKNDVERLGGILCSLKRVDGLNDDLTALKSKANRLAELQDHKQRYDRRKDNVTVTETQYKGYCLAVQTATTELTEAWEAAGGVCPLCNQPVKGADRCTH